MLGDISTLLKGDIITLRLQKGCAERLRRGAGKESRKLDAGSRKRTF